MRAIILKHRTSYSAARRILWHRQLFGGSYSAPWSHERRPHFYIEGLPEGGDALHEPFEIALHFKCFLRPKTVRDQRPLPGFINIHRRAGEQRSFWQATVYEGEFLEFIGTSAPVGGAEVPLEARLRRLIRRRLGCRVETCCRQEGKSELPPEPNAIAWTLFVIEDTIVGLRRSRCGRRSER